MAVKATAGSRAPRGTKTLTQAFFSAADGIPEPQRAAVVKAALTAIREQLKDDREKAKAAKAKAKIKSPKKPVAAKGKKTAARPRRKASPRSTAGAAPETDTM